MEKPAENSTASPQQKETEEEKEVQEKQKSGKSESSEENTTSVDTNLTTLSTKLSTDQLICKSPRNSSVSSIKSMMKSDFGLKHCEGDGIFYYGILQILLGLLMVVFGILVIVHEASLSQIGGGLWGGCLAITTGATGLLSSARQWCPLKTTAQKIARTVFLALSLISLAVAQLVVVLAATGLARDINSVEARKEDSEAEERTIPDQFNDRLTTFSPIDYPSILSNAGLLVVSGIECICAAVSSYKSARDVCPCFRKSEDIESDLAMNNSHAIVTSWLGKHLPPPQLYLVAAPTSSLGKGSKLSGGLPVTPVFMPPPPPLVPPPQQVIGVPLIPAPLGPVPSPIIPPPHRDIMRKRHKKHSSRTRGYYVNRAPTPKKMTSKSKSKSRESLREEDVVRTYTGLDRTIAEEFIDICDSRHASLCSDSSCTSGCMDPANSHCHCGSHTDSMSQESLVHKL